MISWTLTMLKLKKLKKLGSGKEKRVGVRKRKNERKISWNTYH